MDGMDTTPSKPPELDEVGDELTLETGWPPDEPSPWALEQRRDAPDESEAGANNAAALVVARPLAPPPLPPEALSTTRGLAVRVSPPPLPAGAEIGSHESGLQRQGQDGCCVASAVCGLTALVPIVSQVAGVVLGVLGLVRVRRARRRGIAVRGRGWAIAGLISSALVLAGWLAMFGAMSLVGSSIKGSASGLEAALKPLAKVKAAR